MKDKEIVTRLTKDKEDMSRLLKDKEDIIRLMKEKEEMVMLMKEKEDTVSLKKHTVGDRTQPMDEHEDSKHTILKLKLELESVKSSYEECHSLLESKKEDILKLLKDNNNSDIIISKLRQELVVSGRAHRTCIQELESRAFHDSEQFEQKIKELEHMLEDSRQRGRDLEVLLQSKMEIWTRKEIMVNQIADLQIQSIKVLTG
jgi:kinesin family member C2/C3